MKRSRSLIVLMTVAILLFAFAGLVVAAEQDDAATRLEGFGVIEGYPDGTMGLEREITRAEFAKIAVVAKGLEEAADLLKGNASQFTDVQTNVWYTGWVNVANAQGIVKGDPVGTFRPNDNITVAESVAMILRTLGYNDNLPGAWPTNYLVKGAALEVTTGVVTNANAKALRGDVFTMLNRALDEDVVAWAYDDKSNDADFDKKGYTLIQEMKNAKEKTEGIVIRNSRTDDRYKANEIYVAVDKDNNDKGTSGKFAIMSGDSVDYLLGLEVELFHNKDDEVYHVKVKTKDSDIIFDSVDEDAFDTDKERVYLRVEDKDFKMSKDADVYINYEDKKAEDLEEGYYGKFVMDGKEVVFASVFSFDSNGIGVVTKVDGEVVEYVADDATEQQIDLSDADELFLLAPDFKAADMDDIKKNSAIFFWTNDDDEYYVVVKNEIVEGKIDRVQNAKARIDDKNYDRADKAVVTLDEGETYDKWIAVKDIEDANDEDVYAVLDLNGEILFVSTDAEAGGTIYGVITYADLARSGEISVFNKEGKEVTYTFEKRGELESAGISQQDGFKYYAKGAGLQYAVASFKLNSDGEVREKTFSYAAVPNFALKGLGDKNKDLKMHNVTLAKEADKAFFTSGEGNFYLSKDTVMVKALDDNELDPSVQKYDEVVKSALTSNGSAIVFTELGKKDAKLIVFTDNNFVGTGDDSYFGVVTENPWKVGDDWFAKINIFGEGVKEKQLKDYEDFKKGYLVEFTINSSGEIVVEDSVLFNGGSDTPDAFNVTGKNGSYLTIDGEGTFKIDSNAVVYEEDKAGNNKLGSKVSASKIDKNNNIHYLVDSEDGVIKAAILLKTSSVVNPVVKGIVTHITNAVAGPPVENAIIEIDGETTYVVNNNTSIKYDGATIALGNTAVNGKIDIAATGEITLGDQITINGDVITIIKSAKLDAAALITAVTNAGTAKTAYTTAGGLATDAVYKAVDTALTATPQVRANIVSATKALETATKALEVAKVAAAKTALTDTIVKNTNADLANVTAALTVPATDTGVTITWVSNNSAVTNAGVVNQPSYTAGDVTGTLVATIVSVNDATVTDTKVFTVTVKALPATALETAIEAVNNATTVTAMRTALEDVNLTLTLTSYNALTPDNLKTMVAQDVLNARPAAGYADETAIQAALDAAL